MRLLHLPDGSHGDAVHASAGSGLVLYIPDVLREGALDTCHVGVDAGRDQVWGRQVAGDSEGSGVGRVLEKPHQRGSQGAPPYPFFACFKECAFLRFQLLGRYCM